MYLNFDLSVCKMLGMLCWPLSNSLNSAIYIDLSPSQVYMDPFHSTVMLEHWDIPPSPPLVLPLMSTPFHPKVMSHWEGIKQLFNPEAPVNH